MNYFTKRQPENKGVPMKTTVKLFAILASVFAGTTTSLADITTGWLRTSGGTYDFLTSENWAEGNVNGVFSSDLTIGEGQNIVLSDDWTGSFSVKATISGKVQLYASQGPRTITINDDLVFSPLSMSSDFAFGDSASDAKAVNFDLSGIDRSVTLSGTKWVFCNRISNGGLVFSGSGSFTFRSGGGSSGAITLNPGACLGTAFTSADKTDFTGDKAITRAASLTMRRGYYIGSLSYVNAEELIPGMLTIDGSCGGISVMQLRCNSKYDKLTIGGLSKVNGGTLLVNADNLGSEPGNGVQRVFFTSAPTLVGGLVPGVIAGGAYNSTVAGSSYDHTFVTYDSGKGLVPLAATEYSSQIPSGVSSINLRVPGGTTLEIAEPITVNSLYLEGGDNLTANTVITGTVPVTVTSGQVMMQYNAKKVSVINVPLEFGSVTGYIYYGYGKNSEMKGAVGGTGGLVFTQPMSTSSAQSGQMRIESKTMGDNTYTGDTYLNGVVVVGDVDFFPCGSRTGDVYVNGKLLFHNKTINGLYGSGTVTTAYSSSKNMTIGDNDADGDFSGDITFATVNKIGTGTQRFGGTVTVTTLNVNAGSVVLDGALSGAANVAAGAALGGSGGITNDVTFTDGAKLAVTVANDVASCLTVAGTVSGGPVTVDVSIKSGRWKTAQCILTSGTSMGEKTFVKGAGIAALELRNNDTELWATPKTSAFCIVIR